MGLEVGDEGIHIFDIHLVISIKEDDVFDVTRFPKSTEELDGSFVSSAVSAVDEMIDEDDEGMGVLGHFFSDDIGHAVGRSVIDDEDFDEPCCDDFVDHFTDSC